jgi:Cu/Ag efflux pump CusA
MPSRRSSAWANEATSSARCSAHSRASGVDLTCLHSESATDNAPLDMYDTTIMLKDRSEWPVGVTYESLIQQMDAKLHFPGLTNAWTMPVENRLDMELTGIKTPVGMKIQGPSLAGIEQVGAEISTLLSGQKGVQSVFAEMRHLIIDWRRRRRLSTRTSRRRPSMVQSRDCGRSS